MISQQDTRKALIQRLKDAQALTMGLGIVAHNAPLGGRASRPLTEAEADELTEVLEAALEALSESSVSSEFQCRCGQFAMPTAVIKIESRDYGVHARHKCSWGQRESASSETQEERLDIAQVLAETNEALAACQSQAGGRERAAFEAGWRATGAVWGLNWTVSSANTPQKRIDQAYAAYEAQSSPSQSDETPEERKDAK